MSFLSCEFGLCSGDGGGYIGACKLGTEALCLLLTIITIGVGAVTVAVADGVGGGQEIVSRALSDFVGKPDVIY